MEQERLMDYTDSGFKAGFAHGMHVCLTAMLLHLRVDENRVLCTDFDQYHCVINRWPCAPLDANTWPPAEYDRWLDGHWDDPAEKKRLQYRENAIVDPAHLPDRWIQACVWTIAPHDVVDIRPACGKPDTIGNHG